MDAQTFFLDVAPAQALVRAAIRPAPVVRRPLDLAFNRTLAADVVMDIDDPPFDRAVMDGFALRSQDVEQAPCSLRVVGEIAAGASTVPPIGAGQATRINTGAAMPPTADAVVPIEDAQVAPDGTSVDVKLPVRAGASVTPRGKHAAAGQVVLQAGMQLTPSRIAVAAAAGAADVDVYAPARVAILATGDELVGIERRPIGSQIRNSNGYLLEALLRQAGAEPARLSIARDEPNELEEAIRRGLDSDLLLITGGISMGTLDLVPQILERCGVQIAFRKMAIKPGRPTLFGVADTSPQCAVFALPGNPVSAFMGFWLLVRPALAMREGRTDAVQDTVAARLDGSIKPTGDRRTYVPASLTPDRSGHLTAAPTRWHGSGDPFGLIDANALIMRPPNSPAVKTGDRVDVLMLVAL